MNCAQGRFQGIPFRSQRTLSAHPSPLEIGVLSSSLSFALPRKCPSKKYPTNQWEYGANTHHSLSSGCTNDATFFLNNRSSTDTVGAFDKLFVGQEGYTMLVGDAGVVHHVENILLPRPMNQWGCFFLSFRRMGSTRSSSKLGKNHSASPEP